MGQRGADAARVRSERGRGARVSRALGPGDARVGGPHDPLRHRADAADVRAHLFRRTRALSRVRGGRAGALPPPADGAGARPRPPRGGMSRWVHRDWSGRTKTVGANPGVLVLDIAWDRRAGERLEARPSTG